MKKVLQKIDIETGVSISVISILLGGVVWLTNVYADVREQKTQIIELKKENDLIKSDIREILLNTRELKVKLELITKKEGL